MKEKTRLGRRKIASKLYTRAFILGLSYHTTWIYYMEDWEKDGYSYEVIMNIIAGNDFERYQNQGNVRG